MLASELVAAVITAFLSTSPSAHDHAGQSAANPPRQEKAQSEANSAFFDTMKSVMTGQWEGRYTNGTFEDPTDWIPVSVEYRLTASETAIIEDYFDPAEPNISMTTVYYKDRDDLRLTHYCGAANHPSMLATALDADKRKVDFDFTHITNLQDRDDYHSRRFELEIVTSNHIRIQYHGVMNGGQIASQAYDLKRAD